MSDRATALSALEGLHKSAFVFDEAHDKNVAALRAVIGRAFPPEEDENADPVGAPPGWVIEITNGKEWAPVPVGPKNGHSTKAEAQR